MPLIMQNEYPKVTRNARLNLLLLIYILINTLNDYATIQLRLI